MSQLLVFVLLILATTLSQAQATNSCHELFSQMPTSKVDEWNSRLSASVDLTKLSLREQRRFELITEFRQAALGTRELTLKEVRDLSWQTLTQTREMTSLRDAKVDATLLHIYLLRVMLSQPEILRESSDVGLKDWLKLYSMARTKNRDLALKLVDDASFSGLILAFERGLTLTKESGHMLTANEILLVSALVEAHLESRRERLELTRLRREGPEFASLADNLALLARHREMRESPIFVAAVQRVISALESDFNSNAAQGVQARARTENHIIELRALLSSTGEY